MCNPHSTPSKGDSRLCRNTMRHILITVLSCIALTFSALAQSNVVERASQLELKGQFKEAAAVLNEALASGKASPTEQKDLGFELDRLARIKLDFCWTQDDLFNELKDEVKDLTRAEFDGWVDKGWFESRKIDGKTFIFHDDDSNVLFRHPELYARQIPPPDEAEHERERLEIVTAIKKAAAGGKEPLRPAQNPASQDDRLGGRRCRAVRRNDPRLASNTAKLPVSNRFQAHLYFVRSPFRSIPRTAPYAPFISSSLLSRASPRISRSNMNTSFTASILTCNRTRSSRMTTTTRN